MQSNETWKRYGLRATEEMDRATKGGTRGMMKKKNQLQGPCLTSGLTIYLQYPGILLRLQHICVTKISTSMDIESLFVILFIGCISQVGIVISSDT